MLNHEEEMHFLTTISFLYNLTPVTNRHRTKKWNNQDSGPFIQPSPATTMYCTLSHNKQENSEHLTHNLVITIYYSNVNLCANIYLTPDSVTRGLDKYKN